MRSLSYPVDAFMSYIHLETDGYDEVHRKRLMVTTSMLAVAAICIVLIGGGYVLFASLWILGVNLGLLGYLAVTKTAGDTVFEAYIWMMCIPTMCLDLKSAARGVNRDWPLFIVYLDLLLMCKVGRGATYRILGLLTVWMILTQGELAHRYGLFDVWFVSKNDLTMRCNCSDPPCVGEIGLVWGSLVPVLFVVFLDFYITKGFANRWEEEKRKMAASIEATECIATALASFDLAMAAASLDSNPDLPHPLASAFHTLVANLDSYRPFIPATLLHQPPLLHPADASSPTPPPGLDTNIATIVFTDIYSPAGIWEASPEGMTIALRTHNAVVQAASHAHYGYHVKTIGDAHMLAFDDPQAACAFAVSVQLDLYDATWPDDIHKLPQCALSDTGPWRGLRIRVGMNTGKVAVEPNVLTGRVDYFGPTVNKAARIEATCVPGTAALPLETLELVTVMDHWFIAELGNFQLTGVVEECELYTLVAKVMQRRAANELEEPQEHVLPSTSITCSIIADCESVATTGVVRYPVCVGERGGELVSAVLNACNRTDGIAMSVVGTMIVTTWNCVRRCKTHFENAFRFATLLRGMSLYDLCTPHVGLAVGHVVHAVVGSLGQKFTTVRGEPASLAVYLVSAAMAIEAFCLMSVLPGLPAEDLPFVTTFLQSHARPIDTWAVHDGPEVSVFEVRVEAEVKNALANAMVGVKDTVPWAWGGAYSQAFEERDVGALLKMAEQTGGDAMLRKVIQLLATESHIFAYVHL